MRAVRKLFRDHGIARTLGTDVDGLREARDRALRAPGGEGLLARRDVLRHGAAGLAALAVARPAPSFAMGGGPRIAIVGAGIAGLTCALRLRDRGLRADIYEASHRVGGRMFSNRGGQYWEDGQVSEWGGELIDSDDATLHALVKRFRLPLDNVLKAQSRGTEDTFYFFGDYYRPAAADRDFSAIWAALQADVETLGDISHAESTPASRALDRMTVYEWIESRVPGGHQSPLGRLLDAAYAPEFAADTAEQSAINLIWLLGFQPDASGNTLSIFGESDEAFHIRGGNDQLPRAIADHLGDGAIGYGMALESLRRTSSGAYRLTFAGPSPEVEADYVVMALPFAVLRTVDLARAGFDGLKMKAIREVGPGHSAKLQLQFAERLWNESGPWGRGTGSSYTDLPYQSHWEVTRGQRGRSGILTFFMGGTPADSMLADRAFGTSREPRVNADAASALARAEEVFPGLSRRWNGKATQSLWHKHPHALGSYPYYRPGQYASFSGYEEVAQGGVVFAGDATTVEFQGYMEGGAFTGLRAADELIQLIRG
jgi:monoamine oxidase